MRRRFVVQCHELRPGEQHWDLMVERTHGGPLVTWKLEGPLPPAGGGTVYGRRSQDHRAAYLTFEGAISGGRGHVRIVAQGETDDVAGDPDAARFVFAVVGGGSFEVSSNDEDTAVIMRLG